MGTNGPPSTLVFWNGRRLRYGRRVSLGLGKQAWHGVCIDRVGKDESRDQGLLLHSLWVWSMMEYYIVLMIFWTSFFLFSSHWDASPGPLHVPEMVLFMQALTKLIDVRIDWWCWTDHRSHLFGGQRLLTVRSLVSRGGGYHPVHCQSCQSIVGVIAVQAPVGEDPGGEPSQRHQTPPGAHQCITAIAG